MWWNVRTAIKAAVRVFKVHIKPKRNSWIILAKALTLGEEESKEVKAAALMGVREAKSGYFKSIEGSSKTFST